METARTFDSLMSAGRFLEASSHLADDFVWTAPNKRLDKTAWLNAALKMKHEAPIFEDFELGRDDLQVTRKGRKRFMMITINFVQTLQITADGKIKKISVAKA